MKMDVDLSQFCEAPFTYNELASQLENYAAPKNKVQYMERQGKIVRLKKGMYVNAHGNASFYSSTGLIANHLYGPSYVSLHTALRYYGLIPEHVYTTTSVTMGRSREIINKVGRFTYTHVAPDYYPIGITRQKEDDLCFLMATPEKALCDLIVCTKKLRLRSLSSLLVYLEEDMRIDMELFAEMNPGIFEACAQVSKKSQTLLNLAKLLRR